MLIPFLRFKVHLERRESSAAMEQLKAMMRCDDYAKEYLQVFAIILAPIHDLVI